MNKEINTYKNMAALKGRIDPATVHHAERAIELSDKIEYWFTKWQSEFYTVPKQNAERKVRMYANQF